MRHCFQLIFDLRYIAIDRLKLPVKLSDGIVERVASFDNCAGECEESRETGGKSNYRFQTAGHDRKAKSTLRGIKAKKLLLGPVSHSGCIASSKLYSLVSKESFGSPTLICEHHTTGWDIQVDLDLSLFAFNSPRSGSSIDSRHAIMRERCLPNSI